MDGDKEGDGEKTPYRPEAVEKERQSTDVLFLVLFGTFWIGMLIVAGYAWSKGNADRLMYGYDMNGNVCGIDNAGTVGLKNAMDLSSKQYLYYADLTNLDIQICVKECPKEAGGMTKDGVICLYNVEPKDNLDAIQLIYEGKCFPKYSTGDLLHRCVPDFGSLEDEKNETLVAVMKNAKRTDTSSKLFADIYRAKYLLIGCCFITLVFCFVWLFLMRYTAKFIVWGTVFAVIAISAAMTYVFWKNYAEEKDHYNSIPEHMREESDADSYKAMLACSIIMAIFTAIILLIVIAMRKKIALAVQIVKEAAVAVGQSPSIIGIPIVIFIALMLFFMYWLSVSLGLATAGQPRYYPDGTFKGYEANDTLRQIQGYHFFGLLWTSQFLIAVLQCSIAGVIATWYFTQDKDKLPAVAAWHSMGRVIRYHLGSLAFGSLIIAIVQFVRAVIKYMDEQTKEVQKHNCLLRFAVKCIQCCMACVERFLKFISRNAYIVVAIHGCNFCTGSRKAFQLIRRNMLKMMALDMVGAFIIFLAKVCITAGMTWIAFEWAKSLELHIIMMPVCIISVLSYFITSAFMEVFDMAMDTILLCFCEDIEMNNGDDKPYYASQELCEYVEGNEKKNAKKMGQDAPETSMSQAKSWSSMPKSATGSANPYANSSAPSSSPASAAPATSGGRSNPYA